MKWLSFEATMSVAYKEFLHILPRSAGAAAGAPLPPLFTLLFGHAFETSELTDVNCLLINRDNTPPCTGIRRYHFQEQDVPVALRTA